MCSCVFRKISILIIVISLFLLSSCKKNNDVLSIDETTIYGSTLNYIVKAETSGDENLEKVLEFKEYVNKSRIIKDGILRSNTLKEKRNDFSYTECYVKNKRILQKIDEIKKQEFDYLISVAEGLVGYGGDCLYIASLFIQRYFGPGHTIANIYRIEDPIPGDVLYYFDGGLGIEHWAIYLGPNLSLQGNFNGIAIIYPSIYLNNATNPIYYRVA